MTTAKRIALALGALLGLLAPAGAQDNPNFIPPPAPQWQALYSYEGGIVDMLETTTAGRAGDIGYVWRGRFTQTGAGPTLFHTWINCRTRAINEDWQVVYGGLPEVLPATAGPLANSYAPADEAQNRMVDTVCAAQPLALSGVSYGMAATENWAKTGVPGAAPDVPPQFVLPQRLALMRAGILENGYHVFVETNTAGRVGDTGYAWYVRVSPAVTLERPIFEHWVVDCTDGHVTMDWQIKLDGYYLIARQGAQDFRFGTYPDTAPRVALDFICADAPADHGRQIFASLEDAIVDTSNVEFQRALEEEGWDEEWDAEDWEDSEPPAPATPAPGGLDATLLPPVMHHSLAELAGFAGVDISFKFLLEENWIERNGSMGAAWVVYIQNGQLLADGTIVGGNWSKLLFDCDAHTYRRAAVAMVSPDERLLYAEAGADAFVPLGAADSPEGLAAAAACRDRYPASEAKRYTSLATAHADVRPAGN